MLPFFPTFKRLEIEDRNDLLCFINNFPSYSDFNFTSLWSWDVQNKREVSILKGNLIIRFTDYVTGEPFYSFLGNENVNETVEELLRLSISENLPPVLRLIPEEALANLNLKRYEAMEDRDNFDYIYNILELKEMEGKKFSKKRNQVNSFLSIYPNIETKELDLNEPNTQEKIFTLCQEWMEKKKIESDELFESHEGVVLKKLLMANKLLELIGIGIFAQEKLIGFFIEELTDSEYVVAHSSKIDNSFIGVNSYLMKKNAEMLFNKGKSLFNYEQDLGLENLRDAKMRFRPYGFLKQYHLTYRA
jgi:hypothetical protein